MGVAVASSSPAAWVEGRLADVGLESHFVVVSCRSEHAGRQAGARPVPRRLHAGSGSTRPGRSPSRTRPTAWQRPAAAGLAACRGAELHDRRPRPERGRPDRRARSRLSRSKRRYASCAKQRGRPSSRHDEDREAAPPEELAGHAAEVEMGVGRTSHDDEVGLAGLRQELELGANVAAAAGEVAADVRPKSSSVTKRARRSSLSASATSGTGAKKPPMAAAPGRWATKQAWTQPCSRTAKPTAMAKAR